METRSFQSRLGTERLSICYEEQLLQRILIQDLLFGLVFRLPPLPGMKCSYNLRKGQNWVILLTPELSAIFSLIVSLPLTFIPSNSYELYCSSKHFAFSSNCKEDSAVHQFESLPSPSNCFPFESKPLREIRQRTRNQKAHWEISCPMTIPIRAKLT